MPFAAPGTARTGSAVCSLFCELFPCLLVALQRQNLQQPPASNCHILAMSRCCCSSGTIAEQRQALSHLYTALASLLRNKDKHFPISTQHLLRCCETKTSTFPSLHSTCRATFQDISSRQALSHLLLSSNGTSRATFQDFPSREMGKYGT